MVKSKPTGMPRATGPRSSVQNCSLRRPHPACVARPRLFEHISGGLDNPLILVTAPAGYGKTTLLSSWLRQARIPSAWISLDENDN